MVAAEEEEEAAAVGVEEDLVMDADVLEVEETVENIKEEVEERGLTTVHMENPTIKGEQNLVEVISLELLLHRKLKALVRKEMRLLTKRIGTDVVDAISPKVEMLLAPNHQKNHKN